MEKSTIDLNVETSSASASASETHHIGLENVVIDNENLPSQRSKLKWSKEANILLISGRLNTSKDVVVGNDQTSAKFLDRIAEYFNTNHKGEERRTGKQCKDHWGKMNQKVTRFNGCYKRVQQAHHSG
ncbi:glutathione S-transferase T3-like [Cannabis sativa]|uniref:glutathione S-transferase T3-like n=1 Tax=Cannabis sativa TaxID=3483 RepID=UPI0029CA12AF|nr:glutathione S-transferase T3-like [Cannabis sativa]